MSEIAATDLLLEPVDIGRPGRIGLFAVLLAVGALGAWSVLAPIASAVITPGVVVVENSRRVVQHADGGIVKSIAVQDGAHVRAGDVLVTLDDKRLTTAQASTKALLELNKAQIERLLAERNGVNPSSPLDVPVQTAENRAGSSQVAQFNARRNAVLARMRAISSERLQTEAELPGLEQQIDAHTTRLRLTEEDLRAAEDLAKSGWGTRLRVRELGRARADVQALLSGLKAHAAELRVKIDQSPIDIEKINSAFVESVESDLHVAQRERVEFEEKLNQVDEQLGRTQVTAPVSGTIVNLAVHTVGGVISAGSVLMEVVPENEKLVIESQIRPEDADGVHLDATVDVRVSGAGSKRTKRLIGRVVSVSADRLTDRLRGNSYFVLRAEVPRVEFEAATERALSPGMPVELFVMKGQRTIVEYLVSPMTDFFSKSFRQ